MARQLPAPGTPRAQRLLERCAPHVHRLAGPDACWVWTGAQHARGAPIISRGEWRGGLAGWVSVRRVSWWAAHGRDPGPLRVRATCGRPLCVRASHLAAGGQSRALRVMVAQDRAPGAKLTAALVLGIRAAATAGATALRLAHQHHVHLVTIRRVLSRRTWRDV